MKTEKFILYMLKMLKEKKADIKKMNVTSCMLTAQIRLHFRSVYKHPTFILIWYSNQLINVLSIYLIQINRKYIIKYLILMHHLIVIINYLDNNIIN